MKKRELSGIYFRIHGENVDWLDMSLPDRANILADKDEKFIRNMINILRDLYDVMSEYAFHTRPTRGELPKERELLVEELEMLTSRLMLLAEREDFHYEE